MPLDSLDSVMLMPRPKSFKPALNWEANVKDIYAALSIVSKDGSALGRLNPSFQRNKKVVLEAVNHYGYAIFDADISFWKDKDVMLAAVKYDGTLLKYAGKALRADREVVLAAVKQNASAIGYADVALQKDPQIELIVIEKESEKYMMEQNDKVMASLVDSFFERRLGTGFFTSDAEVKWKSFLSDRYWMDTVGLMKPDEREGFFNFALKQMKMQVVPLLPMPSVQFKY